MVDDYHSRLSQRINQLLAKAELQVNQADLVKEVAVFAERADICEEIQRLTSHLEAFEQACRIGEHAGRKLDFIAQEMLREANTIASKANDAHIARHMRRDQRRDRPIEGTGAERGMRSQLSVTFSVFSLTLTICDFDHRDSIPGC